MDFFVFFFQLYTYMYLYFFLREGNSNPLQYSCPENPVDRGAWWAAVHRVTHSQTWLKHLSMHACIGEENGNPLQYSCLENPRDRGAWWAAIYGVTQSRTQLKRLSSSSILFLDWKIPWTEEPGGLWSTGLKSWTRLNTHTCTFSNSFCI